MFKQISFFAALIFVLVGTFGSVGFVSADVGDPCVCFCAIDGSGATRYPVGTNTKMQADDCTDTCSAGGYSVAVCAGDASEYPTYNPMCFTEDQCDKQHGRRLTDSAGNLVQPGDCDKGMTYCYPDPDDPIREERKTTLAISIGGLEITDDLGEYIAAAYRWMIGAGTTIAIVFLMVAGFRWALGGLTPEQVNSAKKTIRNAIAGLVLLLSTTLILYTVNPYLLKMQVPQLPMVKTVDLVGEGSCGYLWGWWGDGQGRHYEYLTSEGAPSDSPFATGQASEGEGYEITGHTDGERCGSFGEINQTLAGDTVSTFTCVFDYCPNPDGSERCFVTVAGGDCYSCSDFSYAATQPIDPVTADVCAKFDDCAYASKSTFVTGLGSLLGISEEVTEWTKESFCYSCAGKSCYSYGYNIELCSLDPCEFGCQLETNLGDITGAASFYCAPE